MMSGHVVHCYNPAPCMLHKHTARSPLLSSLKQLIGKQVYGMRGMEGCCEDFKVCLSAHLGSLVIPKTPHDSERGRRAVHVAEIGISPNSNMNLLHQCFPSLVLGIQTGTHLSFCSSSQTPDSTKQLIKPLMNSVMVLGQKQNGAPLWVPRTRLVEMFSISITMLFCLNISVVIMRR